MTTISLVNIHLLIQIKTKEIGEKHFFVMKTLRISSPNSRRVTDSSVNYIYHVVQNIPTHST